MVSDSQIEGVIQSEISSGILPSVVFRKLLSEHPDIQKSHLGAHFRVAFPNVDGVVWNIVVHWQASKNSEVFDMHMNISLINELIEAKYKVAWNKDWLEQQWQLIEPFLSSSNSSKT